MKRDALKSLKKAVDTIETMVEGEIHDRVIPPEMPCDINMCKDDDEKLRVLVLDLSTSIWDIQTQLNRMLAESRPR